jgi:SAM-dependent methyltransferase
METGLAELDSVTPWKNERMCQNYEDIKLKIRDLYDQSVDRFGDSSRGVGWKDERSHELRLRVLSEIGITDGTSVLDVGCGYGALLEYLRKTGMQNTKYTGIDIAEKMIERARQRFGGSATFKVADIMKIEGEYDYVVNLGIFNVKLGCHDDQFFNDFVRPILFKMWSLAMKGLAASFMTNVVDYRNPDLYYADSSKIINLVARELSRYFVIRHDYDLHEFTLYVYRSGRS